MKKISCYLILLALIVVINSCQKDEAPNEELTSKLKSGKIDDKKFDDMF